MQKNSIFIATPTANGVVSIEYMNTLSSLIMSSYESRSNFSVAQIVTTTSSELTKSRNLLAAKFMESSCTHILFFDSDMGFNPNLLTKMLVFGKPFIGTLYPHRRVDPRIYHRMCRRFDDSVLSEKLALNFVSAEHVIYEDNKSDRPAIRVIDGFVKTEKVGTGILLLRRCVFEAVYANYPDLWSPANISPYKEQGLSGKVHQCFSNLQDARGEFQSEDLSFCERWTTRGGDIWACVDEDVTHVGPRAFTSSYIERLKLNIIQRKV